MVPLSLSFNFDSGSGVTTPWEGGDGSVLYSLLSFLVGLPTEPEEMSPQERFVRKREKGRRMFQGLRTSQTTVGMIDLLQMGSLSEGIRSHSLRSFRGRGRLGGGTRTPF